LDKGDVFLDLQELIDLFLVFRYHILRLHPAKTKGELLGHRRGKEVKGYGTEGLGPEFTKEPFRVIIGNDADGAAPLEPKGRQTERDLLGILEIVAPCIGLPYAKVFLPDGDSL